MAVIVQKYGGTSVGDVDKIRRVARRITRAADEGNRVVVVVSAMGHSTDELMDMALQISPTPPARELDMLLSSGERISMALLSMALIESGYQAVSLTGSQAGIMTDTTHTRARIVEVRARRIEDAMKAGKIAIVAGFQGVSTDMDVTTLGRGGSDTTAVALASALKAEVCEIYTDVDGVYSADPRIVPGARKLHVLSYEEMLEMSASGAGVLSLRSVEYARTHGVVIHCRSSFSDEDGTFIKQEDERMEKAFVTSVTHDTSEAMVRIRRVPDRPGIAARILGEVAKEHINVDVILQNISQDGQTDLSFTIPKEDLARSSQVIERIAKDIGAEGHTVDHEIAKVSLVGAGMKSHPGVAAECFTALADAEINIEAISTSSIRILCVVRADEVEKAVQVLHDRFDLPNAAVFREH